MSQRPETPGLVQPAQAHVPSQNGYGLDDQIYNRLLRERIIFLGTEVRDENANAICAQLLLLAAEDPNRDIHLYINSPGGSVSAGMAIYDTMQFVKPEVITLALGFAASMGQFLLTAGSPGKRYALPHSKILMHQPHGGVGGTATDIRIHAEAMVRTKQEMARLTAEHTGRTLEQVELDADRDRYFTAEEALEYGFIDHVVQSSSQVTDGGSAPGGSK